MCGSIVAWPWLAYVAAISMAWQRNNNRALAAWRIAAIAFNILWPYHISNRVANGSRISTAATISAIAHVARTTARGAAPTSALTTLCNGNGVNDGHFLVT